jgi:hypothetical protein
LIVNETVVPPSFERRISRVPSAAMSELRITTLVEGTAFAPEEPEGSYAREEAAAVGRGRVERESEANLVVGE